VKLQDLTNFDMDNDTAGFLQFLEEQPGIKHPWDEPSVPP
jgi:hypothetical protein